MNLVLFHHMHWRVLRDAALLQASAQHPQHTPASRGRMQAKLCMLLA